MEIQPNLRSGNLARALSVGATIGFAWSLPMVSFGNAPAGGTDYVLMGGILSGILVSLTLKNAVVKRGVGGALIAGILAAPLVVFLFVFLSSLLLAIRWGLHNLLLNVLWCGIIALCGALGFILVFIPASLILSGSVATAFLLRAVLLGRKTWPWIMVLIALFSAAMTASARWHPHGISLSGSPEETRAALVEVSPLGTPLAEIKARIPARLHPKTLCFYENAVSLPGMSVSRRKTIWEHWPLGGEHHGKEIISDIGPGGFWEQEDVGACWVFDDHDRLADIFVLKKPDLP